MSATATATVSSSDLLFEQLLEEVRVEVDQALDAMAADARDARRICTRELRFEPDERALEAIVAVAKDTALNGQRRELPRRLLALRVVADRELAGLFASSELDTQRLRRGVVVVSATLGFYEPLRQELQQAIELGDPTDRKHIATCAAAFPVPREDLCAALLLVPRIEAFSQADADSAVRAIAPTLTQGEARRIASFVDGREGARGEAHRACFDALALRSLMEEHLALLEDLLEDARPRPDGSSDDDGQSSDHEADSDVQVRLDDLLGRIDADRVAYQFVSRRLQKQKDMALVAGLKSLVEELGHVSKGLFSSYRQVIACSRDAAALSATGHGGETVEAEELFRQSVAAEIAARQPPIESSDEACLRALRQVRGSKSTVVRDASRRGRFVKPLAAVAAVLVAVSLWVNLGLSQQIGPDQLTYADFAAGLNVSDFGAAGPMLYVQVNGWEMLDTVQRRTRVESLVELAAAGGYTALLVTQESGFAAATWNPEQGTRLTAAPRTTEPRTTEPRTAPLPR